MGSGFDAARFSRGLLEPARTKATGIKFAAISKSEVAASKAKVAFNCEGVDNIN
jgi:hypothetical protein